MEIRVLKYFLKVTQEESITKAAEKLHTTQPNVSRQLNDLEKSIGKKLFERGSRKVTLTQEGLFLKKRAEEIIELTQRTEIDLQNFGQSVNGTVHVGAIESHLMHKIARCIIKLKEYYPHIKYDIFSGSVSEITDRLDKGLIDFAITIAPIDVHKYNYLKLSDTDSFGLLMGTDNPLAKKKVIQPQDINNYPVWVAHQQLAENALSGWLGRDISSLNIIGTFNLIKTPEMMVEEGLGMAFTFSGLVNCNRQNHLCFRLLEPEIKTNIYLVWKKEQLFTEPAHLFLKEIKKIESSKKS